jgi:hypothetical protein
VNIVRRSIQEPLRQIAENAGEEGAIVLGKVNDSKDNNYGCNALTGDYGVGRQLTPRPFYCISEWRALVEIVVSPLSAENAERWGTLFLGWGCDCVRRGPGTRKVPRLRSR